MVNGVFTRGTTPTFAFPIPEGVDYFDLKDYTICFRQKKNNVITKYKRHASLVTSADLEQNIVLTLTQEESLLFNPKINIVDVQIKAITKDEKVFIIGTYKYRLEDAFDQNELI